MNVPADPRAYRTAFKTRIFIFIMAGSFLVAALAGTVYFGRGGEGAGAMDTTALAVTLAALALFSRWGIASAARHQVTLAPDSVEQRGLFSTRRLHVEDIEGFRMANVKGSRILMLMPKEGAGKRLNIELSFPLDDAFQGWLATLTDLNQRDAAEMLKRVERDTLLGDTPAARVERIAAAQRHARWLYFASIVVAVWTMAFAKPSILALAPAALLPLLAFWLCWRYADRFTLTEFGRESPRANLFVAVLLPSFGLVMPAMFGSHLIDWTLTLNAALVGGALMALGAGAARGTATRFLLIAGLMALYPAGLLPLVNRVVDTAAPRPVAATVDAKRHERYKGDKYYLTLSPWIDAPSKQVQVSHGMYRRVEQGSQVCILLHPGALRMAWYGVADGRRCKVLR